MRTPVPNKVFPFIWYLLKDYKPYAFIYILLAVVAGFWGPINSYLLKWIVNLLPQASHDVSILILPASLIVANLVLCREIPWRGLTYIRYRCLPFVITKIGDVVLGQVLRHSYQFFQERMAGQLARSLTGLDHGIERFVNPIAFGIVWALSGLAIALVSSYLINPIFCIILAIWSVVFIGVSLFMSKHSQSLSGILASKESALGGQNTDIISNALTVAIFGTRKYEMNRRAKETCGFIKAFRNQQLYTLLMQSIQAALVLIMISTACFALIHLYGKGLITIGDFPMILNLLVYTAFITGWGMDQFEQLTGVLGKCQASLTALITPIEIVDKPNAKVLECRKGQIEFDGVTFNYKNTGALFVNKSVTIKAGQKVGLVGYSGGGKSSFVALILRLYDVLSGAILIDDQDIRDVTQDSLRQNIAMIPQDPALFNRTLMENIRYGRVDASDDEVIEASKAAHVHEFIQALPDGYNSMVGDRGVKLSGGQRQRIAMARAILKDAPILILDEATSQLDSVTEGLIQDSLFKVMQGKTVVVIAHRLSTLTHMDRILVFDKGHIVQDGRHEELVQSEGTYKILWETQVGGFIKTE